MIDYIREIRAELKKIDDLLNEASDLQWSRPSLHIVESGGGGRSSLPSDPTGDTASNADRLTLRRRVDATDTDLSQVFRKLEAIHYRLESDLSPWRR